MPGFIFGHVWRHFLFTKSIRRAGFSATVLVVAVSNARARVSTFVHGAYQ